MQNYFDVRNPLLSLSGAELDSWAHKNESAIKKIAPFVFEDVTVEKKQNDVRLRSNLIQVIEIFLKFAPQVLVADANAVTEPSKFSLLRTVVAKGDTEKIIGMLSLYSKLIPDNSCALLIRELINAPPKYKHHQKDQETQKIFLLLLKQLPRNQQIPEVWLDYCLENAYYEAISELLKFDKVKPSAPSRGQDNELHHLFASIPKKRTQQLNQLLIKIVKDLVTCGVNPNHIGSSKMSAKAMHPQLFDQKDGTAPNSKESHRRNPKNKCNQTSRSEQDFSLELSKPVSKNQNNHEPKKTPPVRTPKEAPMQKAKMVYTKEEIKPFLESDIQFELECIKAYNAKSRQNYETLIDKVRSRIEKELNVEVKVFGSFATELSLPESDIDLLIVPDSRSQVDSRRLLGDVVIVLSRMKEQIEEVKLISTATVPIVKATCTDRYNYKQVDITIKDINHKGLEAVELVKAYLNQYPEIEPLIFILKKFVYHWKLFNPYNGGISSYALILMIVSFLQNKNYQRGLRKKHEGEYKDTTNHKPPEQSKKYKTAELLIEFLLFFGHNYEYRKCILAFKPKDVKNIDYYQGSFVDPERAEATTDFLNIQEKLYIRDPIKANNNVGRSTYRIPSFRMSFVGASVIIHTYSRCIRQKKTDAQDNLFQGETDESTKHSLDEDGSARGYSAKSEAGSNKHQSYIVQQNEVCYSFERIKRIDDARVQGLRKPCCILWRVFRYYERFAPVVD